MKKIIELIKQNKFYSAMMIISTAITVTCVMATFLVSILAKGDFSPENNRSRSTYVYHYFERNNEIFTGGGLSEWVSKELYDNLQSVETYYLNSYQSRTQLEVIDYNNNYAEVELKVASEEVFNVYDYEFLEGRAYNNDDIEAGSKVAVLSELGAYRLLGKNRGVVGEYITLLGDQYEIIGLTRNTTYIMKNTMVNSFYEVLMPTNYDNETGAVNGRYLPFVELKKGYSFEEFREELIDSIKSFNNKFAANKGDVGVSERVEIPQDDQDMIILSFVIGFMCLLFILIPSINGIGLSQSYISQRLSEIAIRRAYGASNTELVWSLVWDNVWITSIGAVLGLILSYYVSGQLTAAQSGAKINEVYESVAFIPSEMYFDIKLYMIAIITNIVFNVCAIYLPARKAIKQPISTIIKGE